MSSFVVSLRSRGLTGFSKAKFLNWRSHLVNIGHEILDLFVAITLNLWELSWSSWLSVILLIIVVCQPLQLNSTDRLFISDPVDGVIVASNFHITNLDNGTAVDLFMPPFVIIIIPLLVFIHVAYIRRDKAARGLGKLKSSVVGICHLMVSIAEQGDQPVAEAAAAVMSCVFQLADDTHQYLQHRRLYNRHFFVPYLADNKAGDTTLYKLSHELGTLLRRVHRTIVATYDAAHALPRLGASSADVRELEAQITALHMHVEQLSRIKEMRTPVLLRALFRWSVVLLFPVIMGYYWRIAGWGLKVGSLDTCLGVLMQFVLGALHDTLVNLEDPFEDRSLDTVSLLEILDHISLMTSPDDEYNNPDSWMDVGEKVDRAEEHTTVTIEMMSAEKAAANNTASGAEEGEESSGRKKEQVGGGGGGARIGRYQAEAVMSAAGAKVPAAPPMPPMTSMGAGEF